MSCTDYLVSLNLNLHLFLENLYVNTLVRKKCREVHVKTIVSKHMINVKNVLLKTHYKDCELTCTELWSWTIKQFFTIFVFRIFWLGLKLCIDDALEPLSMAPPLTL